MLSDIIVDDRSGFRVVHEEYAKELREALSKRVALHRFVLQRLGSHLAKSRRYAAAFHAYRIFDPSRALASARRASWQASSEGKFAQSIEPFQYIASTLGHGGERDRTSAYSSGACPSVRRFGQPEIGPGITRQGGRIADVLQDNELRQIISDQRLIRRVRQDLKPEDLDALRKVRERYEGESRNADAARLAIEESVVLISVHRYEDAITILRKAKDAFDASGDPTESRLPTKT